MEAYERLHRRIAALHAPEIADLNLTLAQLKAIYLAAAAGSIRMGALAVQLGTALSTTSGVVDRLVQLGLAGAAGGPVRPPTGARPGDARRRSNSSRACPSSVAGGSESSSCACPTPADIDIVKQALSLLADAAAELNEDSPS